MGEETEEYSIFSCSARRPDFELWNAGRLVVLVETDSAEGLRSSGKEWQEGMGFRDGFEGEWTLLIRRVNSAVSLCSVSHMSLTFSPT